MAGGARVVALVVAEPAELIEQRLAERRLLGAAEADRERMGSFLQPSDTPEYQRILGEVREHLDDRSFEAAWAEGRRLTLEQAFAYALKEVEDAR